MKKPSAQIALGLAILWLFISCKNSDSPDFSPINPLENEVIPKDVRDVYSIMRFNYLWADQAIQEVKIDDIINYIEATRLVEDMRVEIDKFTYIEKGKELLKELQGQPSNNGLTLRYLNDTLYIAYIEPNSPAERISLERGFWIKKIADITVTPKPIHLPSISIGGQLKLSYYDHSEVNHTVMLIPSQYNRKTVNHVLTKQIEDKKVGYFVFSSFLERSEEELENTFAFLKKAGVDELILDMRYNSGGFIRTAQKLASLINSKLKGKIFLRYLFNDQFSKYLMESDSELGIQDLYFTEEKNSLNLNRIFILTDERTASASEATINGLKPFIDVQIIGKTTVGKNVGSILYVLEEHAFLPIVFKTVNSKGLGNFSDGFKPDKMAIDNVKFPLGDEREDMFFQALHYIMNERFYDVPGRISSQNQDIFPSNIIHTYEVMIAKIHQN